jgi:hypothetical protein
MKVGALRSLFVDWVACHLSFADAAYILDVKMDHIGNDNANVRIKRPDGQIRLIDISTTDENKLYK